MSEPYVGEIRMFGGNFNPQGWAFCDGQLLPISENDTLFALIGTTYGGDGQSTFGLPDLRGRVPVHMGTLPKTGSVYGIGELAGVEAVTVTVQQIAPHNHPAVGSTNTASSNSPTNNVPGRVTIAGVFPYGTDGPFGMLNQQAIGPAGGNEQHTNIQPYLAINFIISLYGIFPTPS